MINYVLWNWIVLIGLWRCLSWLGMLHVTTRRTGLFRDMCYWLWGTMRSWGNCLLVSPLLMVVFFRTLTLFCCLRRLRGLPRSLSLHPRLLNLLKSLNWLSLLFLYLVCTKCKSVFRFLLVSPLFVVLKSLFLFHIFIQSVETASSQ